VQDENGDLPADSHNISNRWKNYFSHLLNAHNISDVRQIEMHTFEPVAPGPSRLEAELGCCKVEMVFIHSFQFIFHKYPTG
jgi:hypothetical protein